MLGAGLGRRTGAGHEDTSFRLLREERPLFNQLWKRQGHVSSSYPWLFFRMNIHFTSSMRRILKNAKVNTTAQSIMSKGWVWNKACKGERYRGKSKTINPISTAPTK